MFFGVNLIGIKHSNGDSNFRTYCFVIVLFRNGNGIFFVNKIRIQKKSEDGDKKATTALFVIENFDKALTTILICNNVVNLSCSSLATVLCMALFGDYGSAIATGATTLLVSHSVRCFLNVWLKKIATAFLLKQQA